MSPSTTASKQWWKSALSLHTTISTLRSHLHTLYLFTAADFPTFAIPTLLFAICGALSGPLLTTNPSPSLVSVLSRTPSALLVVWTNLLIFNMSNQRSPSSIAEDAINKPNRPLPRGLITPEATRRILLALVPAVLLLGWTFGVWQETLFLFTFQWLYNDLAGCDESFVLRNLLIAVGYGLYSSAAFRVLVGGSHTLTQAGVRWTGIVALVMLVTQHICDIKDAAGDRLRGRRSAPIVLGDEMVRWSVSVPIMVCSVLCPWYFGLGWKSYVSVMGIGGIVAGRTMVWRDLASDKLTWKLWAFWTVALFVLPVVASPVVLDGAWTSMSILLCGGDECLSTLNLLAVSGVVGIVEGRRLYGQVGRTNDTVPRIVIDAVVS